LEKKDEIFQRLHERTPAIFLDYDGTLTPIVDDPAEAKLLEQTRKVIRRLAEHYSVAMISGRDLADVQNMVGIENIAYAGSHGFDIAGPGGQYRDQERGRRFLPALDRAEPELKNDLKDIPGARVERKLFAIAVHYRQVDRAKLVELEKKGRPREKKFLSSGRISTGIRARLYYPCLRHYTQTAVELCPYTSVMMIPTKMPSGPSGTGVSPSWLARENARQPPTMHCETPTR
jgi:HAD superfamily hydrolase (TIGR01484 family)